MSKTVKVAMVASLIAPMVLGAQPVSAKSKNVVANMAIATNSQSEVEKITDEIYKTYNNTMQHKDKLKVETIKEYKQDLDSAVTKLVVKLQTEFSIDEKSKQSNQKLIKDVIGMRDEVGQLIKQMEATNHEAAKQEKEKQEKEKAQLIEKNLNASVNRMNKIITKKSGPSTFAAVTTWDDLKEELKNGTEEIQIQGKITADSVATVKVGQQVHLMGDDSASLDMGTNTIEIPKGADLKAENISVTGKQGGSGFSGEGKLTFTGKITAEEGTQAPLASLPWGEIVLEKVVMTLPAGVLYKGTTTFAGEALVAHLDSFNLTIRESTIDSEAANIFAQTLDIGTLTGEEENKESTIIIDGGSKISAKSHGNTPKNSTHNTRDIKPTQGKYLSNTDLFLTRAKTSLTIAGEDTFIEIDTDAQTPTVPNVRTDTNVGAFVLTHRESTFNITGAKVKVESQHLPTITMLADKNSLILDEAAVLDIHQVDDLYETTTKARNPNGAAIKFRAETYTEKIPEVGDAFVRGESILKALNQSQLLIKRDKGPAAGVFLQGAGNIFNADEGSDISIQHFGVKEDDGFSKDKLPAKGFYAAVHFAITKQGNEVLKDSEFKISGTPVKDPEKPGLKFSQVNLTSESGSALVNQSSGIKIIGESQTLFTARGNILAYGKNTPAAAFDTKDKVEFKFDNMNYYDFRNSARTEDLSPHPDARVFNSEDPASFFESKDSDFAVWPAIGKATEASKTQPAHGPFDVDGAPYDSWPVISFKATGKGFTNLEPLGGTALDTGFETNYKTHYQLGMLSRLNANNQAPIIDQLRVPTNADKFIYGHALVPEGKFDAPRDAYPEEVFVKVRFTDKDGKEETLKGHTVEDKSDDNKTKAKEKPRKVLNGKTVYDDEPKPGIFQIDVPNDRFLEPGEKIEVTNAWRSVDEVEGELNNDLVHISNEHKLTAKDQIVQDVTPPDTPVPDKDKIFHLAKELSGYAKEPGTIKLARGKDIYLPTQTETETELTEGKGYRFTLPLPKELNLQEGEILTVLSRNTDQPKEKTDLPINHTVPNEIQNTNPITFDEGIGNITPIDGPMPYHDREGEDGFKPGAKVEVTGGILTMDGNPNFDFGSHAIDTVEKTYYPEVTGKHLIVSDTLGEESQGWSLLLQDVTKEKNPLVGNLYYKKNKDDKPMKISKNASEVANKADSKEEVVNITGSWVKEETGLYTVLPVLDQVPGDFTSTLNWSLVKGVANDGQ